MTPVRVRSASPHRSGRGRAWRAGLALAFAAAPLAHAPASNAKERPPVEAARETADATLHAENVSWERHLHAWMHLPDWLDLAVDQRTRFELLDDPFRPGEPQRQTQVPMRTRVRIGIDGPGPVRLLAELQDARTWNDRPRDFTGNTIDHLDVLQLLLATTLHDLPVEGLRLDAHVGRLTLDVGSRRLLARNAFRNTTNAFDGAHVRIGDAERRWHARAFYTLPVERQEGGVFDDELSARRRFWGLAWSDERIAWLRLDAYYLDLDDLPGDRSLETFGVRGSRAAAPRQIDYEVELIGQLGRRGGRDHSAFAAHGEVGYTFDAPGSPRVVAQLDFATGDDDPSDDDSHAFDPLFGARRFDLMPTGLFGPFRRSNLVSPGVRVIVSPTRSLRLQAKVRHWRLAESRDVFSGTGLRDPSGDAGRDLGTDLELRVQWKATRWLDLDLGYDHWFKGRYLDDVAGARTSGDSDYFYVQSRVRF